MTDPRSPRLLAVGKTDVDVGVLRSVVLSGECVRARAVVNGTWGEDELHVEDDCDWCHLVWCMTEDDDPRSSST